MTRTLALTTVALVACGGDFPTATIGVGDQRVEVEIAATPELRSRGLMHREELDEDRGMLFVYPDVRPRSFWMKNTSIPLSIAFADDEGTITRIADMKPFDTSSTHSLYPTKYALEMNQGWFEAHGVARGAKLADLPSVEAE